MDQIATIHQKRRKKGNIVEYTMKNRIHISKCKKEIHIDLNLSHGQVHALQVDWIDVYE